MEMSSFSQLNMVCHSLNCQRTLKNLFPAQSANLSSSDIVRFGIFSFAQPIALIEVVKPGIAYINNFGIFESESLNMNQ